MTKVSIRTVVMGIAVLLSLSSCLSRRRPAAPVRHADHYEKERRKGDEILTDISDKPKWIAHSGDVLADYASLMDVDVSELENQRLYQVLDEWMGIPYAMGGSSKKGIDCSSFAALVQAEVYGKEIPRISDDQANFIKRKYENQLKEGDLVFFSFGSSKINHVGIYLHNHKFAHASTSKGVIISDLKDPWYYKAFKRAGSVK